MQYMWPFPTFDWPERRTKQKSRVTQSVSAVYSRPDHGRRDGEVTWHVLAIWLCMAYTYRAGLPCIFQAWRPNNFDFTAKSTFTIDNTLQVIIFHGQTHILRPIFRPNHLKLAVSSAKWQPWYRAEACKSCRPSNSFCKTRNLIICMTYASFADTD